MGCNGSRTLWNRPLPSRKLNPRSRERRRTSCKNRVLPEPGSASTSIVTVSPSSALSRAPAIRPISSERDIQTPLVVPSPTASRTPRSRYTSRGRLRPLTLSGSSCWKFRLSDACVATRSLTMTTPCSAASLKRVASLSVSPTGMKRRRRRPLAPATRVPRCTPMHSRTPTPLLGRMGKRIWASSAAQSRHRSWSCSSVRPRPQKTRKRSL